MKYYFMLLSAAALLVQACNNNDSAAKKPVGDSAGQATAKEGGAAAETTAQTSVEPNVDTTVAVAIPDDGIRLAFNLAKGKTYSQVMDMASEQEMQGNKFTTGMNWRYDMKVAEENAGVKTLAATYRRIAMSMNMGGETMEVNSDKAPGAAANNPLGMMGGLFHAMQGKTFYMKVDKAGDLVSVEGFDRIAESVADEMKLEGEARKRLLSTFASQFNNGVVKDMFSQSFNIFPAKKVKVGDSWVKETKGTMGNAEAQTKTTYTVKSIKGNRVELDARSKIKTPSMEADGSGTFYVDARNGVVTSANMLQNISGSKIKGVNRIKISGRELN